MSILDQWRIQKIVLGGEGGLGAVPPAEVHGAETPAPRSWSTNAFCVLVKAFS